LRRRVAYATTGHEGQGITVECHALIAPVGTVSTPMLPSHLATSDNFLYR